MILRFRLQYYYKKLRFHIMVTGTFFNAAKSADFVSPFSHTTLDRKENLFHGNHQGFLPQMGQSIDIDVV